MSRSIATHLPAVFAFVLLAPGGCFNPDDPAAEDETGSTGAADSGGTDAPATQGDTTEPPPPGTDDDGPGSTDGPSDSTGPGDAPPEITAFTVNGSTMPAEMSASGMVTLDVDAVDDVGIDRVEFFDGDELVATADASPYVAEVLVSSADNGSREYSAVVYDTAEQSAVSDSVFVSVNILGGELLDIRDDTGAFHFFAPSAWQPNIQAHDGLTRLSPFWRPESRLLT